MTLALALVIRSSAILLFGLVLVACLGKRSAALRHLVLAAAIGCAALVVPFSFVLPAWQVTLPVSSPAVAAPARAPAALVADVAVPVRIGATPATSLPATAPPRQWPISFLWLAGVVVSGSMLLAGVARLRRITARATRVTDAEWMRIARGVAAGHRIEREVVLLQTDAPDLLATWGILRPRVLLPADAREWPEDRVRIVLCHELAHIRRHDWFVQIAAEALRTIVWFNPLIWVACTRLRRESEQACDDAVLGEGIPAREYAGHLLDLARKLRRPRSPWLTAMPMAHPSTLERRIAAMLNPRLDRQALTRRAFAVIATVLLAVTVPIAAVRQVGEHREANTVTEIRMSTAPPSSQPQAATPIKADDNILSTRREIKVRPVPPPSTRASGREEMVPAAQGAAATLAGSVYDATGAVMPGVAISLEHASQATWTSTTSASGHFEFTAVQPGRYVLAASIPGFKALRQEFDLKDARDWDRAITLQVGDVRESITVKESRMTAPTPPSQPQAATRIRVGGNIRAPRKLEDVRVVYPPSMRAAGREGVVPIEAVIGRDGTVTSVRVLTADVHPDFAIAAVDAVRQWKFSPTLLNGAPVEVVMNVSVTFNLSN